MNKLKKFLERNVTITDINDKNWIGFVESYNPDDDWDNYQGESIDVVIKDTNQIVCFGASDIKKIEII